MAATGPKPTGEAPTRVTLVVPVLDEEIFLAETLTSLRNQTFTDFELVVVDNGSTDRSPQIAQEFADRVVIEPRRGALHAMHRGFTEAKGDLIACADADTLYPPRWLERLVASLDKAGVVAVYGPMGFRESSGPARFLQASGYCALAGLSRLCGVRLAGAANLGMRKDAYFSVGGYPPLVERASPDFRLALRLAEIGWVRFAPTMVCYTANRRFIQVNPLWGSLEAVRYWLDVASRRDRIPGESYWADRETRGHGGER